MLNVKESVGNSHHFETEIIQNSKFNIVSITSMVINLKCGKILKAIHKSWELFLAYAYKVKEGIITTNFIFDRKNLTISPVMFLSRYDSENLKLV